MKNNDKKKKVLFRYLKDKINLIIHILYIYIQCNVIQCNIVSIVIVKYVIIVIRLASGIY